MDRFKSLLVRWPFTLFGLLSFMLLVLSARGVIPVEGVWRALIIAPYAIHLLIVMLAVLLIGTNGPEWALAGYFVLTFPLRFLPFVLVDYLLASTRRQHRPSVAVGDGR
jgi:hypothetical protein